MNKLVNHLNQTFEFGDIFLCTKYSSLYLGVFRGFTPVKVPSYRRNPYVIDGVTLPDYKNTSVRAYLIEERYNWVYDQQSKSMTTTANTAHIIVRKASFKDATKTMKLNNNMLYELFHHKPLLIASALETQAKLIKGELKK